MHYMRPLNFKAFPCVSLKIVSCGSFAISTFVNVDDHVQVYTYILYIVVHTHSRYDSAVLTNRLKNGMHNGI